MHGVVRAQVVPLRDIAGGSCESGTELDDPEGRDGSVDVPLRSRVIVRREPTGTARSRESGPSLRVRDPRREVHVRGGDELADDVGPLLIAEEEFEQGRRIQVTDQRRCSNTNSMRSPFVRTRPNEDASIAISGGVITPAATSSSSRESPEADDAGDGTTALGDDELASGRHLVEPPAQVIAQLADADLRRLSFMWRFTHE